ncbi:suppressor of Mek1-like isoform X2 [Dioscorea cayenensis subsp. rotundata]|uniref:Suppressor of Mek1-like isoform X2 n=1 Tax=Dioscorea cayennensis subsp. rotundata TaxID=55577 RepID=A0AB40CZD5_DIOCR|nr:suppressor of Mek1-like isoform X2 [Dioscorea cayenensis subsp. rotundata]
MVLDCNCRKVFEVLLNNPQIFDRIFGDEFILDILGSLEYDRDIPPVQNHLSFLKEHVIYKEDVILPGVLDEVTIASPSAIIPANNATVVLLLKDDTSFIQELFARMKSPSKSDESKRNLDKWAKNLYLASMCYGRICTLIHI